MVEEEGEIHQVLILQGRQAVFIQAAYLWRFRFQLEAELCHEGNDTVTVWIDLVFRYVSGHIPVSYTHLSLIFWKHHRGIMNIKRGGLLV